MAGSPERRPLESITDLLAVAGLVFLTDLAVFLPWVAETPLRTLLGLPFVAFLPGYALVSALFPGPNDAVEVGFPGSVDPDEGLDGPERIVLSVGLSIATVGLIGVGLSVAGLDLGLARMVLAVTVFTLLAVAIAVVRRLLRPPAQRYRPSPFQSAQRDPLAQRDEDAGRQVSGVASIVLTLVLATAVVVAAASVGLSVVGPALGGAGPTIGGGDDAFTSLYLLSADGTAEEYPRTYTEGESRSLVVGIENHEGVETSYTVVVQLQRISTAGDEVTVERRVELDRFSTTVGAGEGWERDYDVEPTLVGDDLRLTFLLYAGSAPDRPTVDNAYREVHLQITVEENG